MQSLLQENHTDMDGCDKPSGALIGVGRMGKIHLGHVTRNARVTLKYVVDQELDYVKAVLADQGLSTPTPVSMHGLSTVLEDTQ